MPVFGSFSKNNLINVHPDLVRVANKVIEVWDCQVTDGARTVEEQRKNIAKGVSKTMASKHIIMPPSTVAEAVDIMPYPHNWPLITKGLDALKRADYGMQIAEVYAFAGFFDGVAHAMGIKIRSGYDWDSDDQFENQTFHDLPHHEIKRLIR